MGERRNAFHGFARVFFLLQTSPATKEKNSRDVTEKQIAEADEIMNGRELKLIVVRTMIHPLNSFWLQRWKTFSDGASAALSQALHKKVIEIHE